MDWVTVARRRAFSIWLRTGRVPQWARPVSPEVKYNPWHDPDDGRFTFAGTGRYFGRGSPGGGATKRSLDVQMGERSRPDPKLAINGGGASGGYPVPRPVPDSVHDRPTDHLPTPLARIAANHAKGWARTVRNGYDWWLDADGRLREVAGTLTLRDDSPRSRAAQRRAGIPDRRSSDEGGHLIAGRFNGPTEAFNHFAQDRNFNRGRYRALEDQWARALRAGKRVDVRIVPSYTGSSRRPAMINVWFWIDGRRQSQRFPNEPSETARAKR